MRRLALGLILLAVAGCMDDITGAADWNDYLAKLTAASMPATIDCGEEIIEVGETRQCRAYNAKGTLIEVEGFAPLEWSSLNPVRLSITVAGVITARSEGEVTIQVEGPKRSSAHATYVVVAPGNGG